MNVLAFAAVLTLAAPQDPGAETGELVETLDVPDEMTAEQARTALSRSLKWIVEAQKPAGTWGSFVPTDVWELGFAGETYYDWNLASNFLACLALLECEETPARWAALEKGLRASCEKRLPVRGANWDNDAMWAALYAVVTLTRAAQDPRLQEVEWQELLHRRGRDYLGLLVDNQVPDGGWGYYDDPVFSARPKWATSFSTACVVPALAQARDLGWLETPRVLERATRYVDRCRLPSGAYEYDLNPIPRVRGGEHINEIPGSLGRIQVCNWALSSVGVERITVDYIREGLEHLFREHRYLDAARLRPIPHEAYFANAGYFYFFGHYYAAQAINLLPAEEREEWHAKLRPHVAKTQRADGSTSDFNASSYMITASTAFAALTLSLGLEEPGS